MKTIAAALLAGLAHVSLALSPALAEVTVLGWPGGPEETALRAVADIYNKSGVTDDEKVKLIFFNRDGFWDKLQADLAAGSTEFDLNLLPPTPSASTRPSWIRSPCPRAPRRCSARRC